MWMTVAAADDTTRLADGTRVWLVAVAFFLGAIAIKETMRSLLDQIFTACAHVGGNDTYGITGNPYYGWRGTGLCKEQV